MDPKILLRAVTDQLAKDLVIVMAYIGCDTVAHRMLNHYLDEAFSEMYGDTHILASDSLLDGQDVGLTFLQQFKATTPEEKQFHDTIEAIRDGINKYLGVIP